VITAAARLSVETLEKLWANYTDMNDREAAEAREAAARYARNMLGEKHFHGLMVDTVIAEFGVFVYVYSHLGNRLLTPEEYEKEFVKELDSNAPVWVDYPYGKKDEIRLMRYGTVKRSSLRKLIDFMRVRVCTGPCPEKKTETAVGG
jgi:hypothetical protein